MKRVLIADDNAENRYYLSALLGAQGYQVSSARNGAEALQDARKQPPALAISDLLMPEMDGYTLLRHWKADPELRHIPFIVYTATYTDAADERLALDLGADAFILKPAEPDDFLSRVRALEERARAGLRVDPHSPRADDKTLLKAYSERLLRKLEDRTVQLQTANLALQRDIAERIKAERARDEARAESDARMALLDAVLASVPDVVLQLDLAGHLHFINRALPYLQVTPPLGAALFPQLPATQREPMQLAFERVIASGTPSSFEWSPGSALGVPKSYWFGLSPVKRAGRIAGVVLIVRDISERRQTEAQLLASDRMASVGTLAAGVAHEINNPLTSVIANLALASRQLESSRSSGPAVPRALREQLRDASDAAERVRRIVRDLKIFSRAEEDTRGPVDIEQVLEATVRLAWNEVRHRARLVKQYVRLPPVLANESRLGQVFLNLIVNAAHAIEEGNYDRNEIRIETALDPTGRAMISIHDTGCGIAKEVRPRLFTPFFTTKPAGVGTGIGLSICQRIISGLGGSIEFSSEPGHGSTFRVFLPLSTVALAREPRPEPAVSMAGRRGRVLVVDDEVLITGTVARILCDDHEVHTVNSAAQAIALFDRGDRFDVVLCDLMMPQVTGMDLYAALLEIDRTQAARVVFATGGAFTSRARAFLDAVPNPRIEKPFEVENLRSLINRLIC